MILAKDLRAEREYLEEGSATVDLRAFHHSIIEQVLEAYRGAGLRWEIILDTEATQ